MTSDDLMMLTMVMRQNNGVLRPHDHPQSRRAFELLRRTGTIVRVLPGTFVDATRVNERRTRCAAALAASPGAVLWGDQAIAAVAGKLDASPFRPNERVTLAHSQFRRTAPGIRWVRRRVPSEQRRRPDGLRCPSAAYLALEASGRDGGRLIQRFLRERLMTPADLTATLPAFAASPGQDARRRIVRVHLDNPWSGGEKELQDLLRKHRVRGWVANHELEIAGKTYYPDLYIEDIPLVVEFDGYGVHSQADVFETDRIRQNALVRAGITVLRYTWKRLQDDPDAVVAEIKAAIAGEMARDPRRPPG